MHPAVVQACVGTFSDDLNQETLWEPPSHDEWKMAMLIIANRSYSWGGHSMLAGVA
jgi:hypothetical protein